jgi:nitroreductase
MNVAILNENRYICHIMMDNIFKRRSVRRFDGRPVEREKVEQLLEAMFTAPSSKNVRSTRVAVTDNRAALEAVGAMRSRGSRFVAEAPMAFFIMGDAAATDLWRENCSISATVLQLAATELGLGSCWVHVDGRPHNDDDPQGMTAAEWLRERVAGLPDYEILCVVAVGYPAEEPQPHAPHDDSDKVFYL